MSNTRPTLIVDGLNVFYRHWAANPSLDANGEHVGGIVGFIKGLQLLCERYQPSDLIVVWEGGGSPRRRAIDSSYKGGRKPVKLNRFYEDIPNTVENRNSQVAQLVSLLRKAGIKQVYVSDCEADDVIAYLTNYTFMSNKCVIVSTDKDFYQLINDRVLVWSPGSKKQWDENSVIEKFGIHPQNFCLARCFVGDASDGLKGAPGAGFKSLSKRFPAFSIKSNITIDDIVTECRKLREQRKLKLYDSIIEYEKVVKKNWKLMYLGSRNISASQAMKVDGVISEFVPKRNKLEFIKSLMRLQIDNVDYDKLFMILKTLNRGEK
jgi:5'-3' exonuclease